MGRLGCVILGSTCLLGPLALAPRLLAEQAAGPSPGEVTLELIMSDPDWLGNPPEGPYWADDSRSFYYRVKRPGEERRDLIQMGLDGEVLRRVEDEELGAVDVAGGHLSPDGKLKVYSHHGDVFVKDLTSGELRQLTRTPQPESDPRFLAHGQAVSFSRGSRGSGAATVLVRDLENGLEYQPFDLRLAEDPAQEEEEKGYLKSQQERLFDFIQEAKEKEEARREEERHRLRVDPTRVGVPWYLGTDVELKRSSLSPTSEWMIVVLGPREAGEGKADSMPRYVNDSGYVEVEEVRPKVGTGKDRGEEVYLLERSSHTRTRLDLSTLPGITDDPLRELRQRAKERREAERREKEEAAPSPGTGEDGAGEEVRDEDEKPKARPVRVSDVLWSDDGRRVVLQLFSTDNKDRWIAAVDLTAKSLAVVARVSDPAWINWRYRQLGWLQDNETVYYLSEESGYSHLYLYSFADGTTQALTQGEFVVSAPRLSRDGRYLYFTANRDHPGVYESYRVQVAPPGKKGKVGKVEALTRLGGQNQALPSPDGEHLLVRHSESRRPWELYLQKAESGASARPMTHTTSREFLDIPWAEPEFVTIASSHVERPIHARVYTPAQGLEAPPGGYPAVVFVHGAGYLQNAHQGWSNYFREFMFHTFLTQRGYVVLDMDYRASAGYGRDWRTAIYRHMGGPEVEDLEDGVEWLVENRNVNRERVGVYGGSYGGFLTLMSLFKRPGLFACGAALRPVTDWAHYNHPYTSNILNRPDIDPEAYERSSPIELAHGLEDPLLLCHGMLDDNVFFQDTVRLVQRLIELEKEDWETAIYPIEPHGFRQPSSWLNEYRRIFKLFEEHLKP